MPAPGEYDRLTQWAFMLCLPCVPYFLWMYFTANRRVYTLDDLVKLANLGVLYLSQAQYVEAQPYYEHALIMEAELQWSDAPLVSVGVDHLARQAAAQGRDENAVEIYQWALEISENALGADDINTAFLRDRYDRYLRSLERQDELDRQSNS